MKRAKPALAPITSQGLLLIPTEYQEFITTYGQAYGQAERELYQRCVIGQEAWFIKGGGGVRDQLITRGWSQREATSILKSAQAAHTAAIESSRLALIRTEEELAKIKRQLARARPQQRHGLARRRALLRARVARLQGQLTEDGAGIRVCFGSRRVLRAAREWQANGYASQVEAHAVWQRRRAGMLYIEGDKGSVYGNASLKLKLAPPNAIEGGPVECDKLLMRVPSFLRHLIAGKSEIEIPVRGISEKQGRSTIEQAMLRDPDTHTARMSVWQQQQVAHERWQERVAAGEQGPAPRPVAKTPPKLTATSAVSVRINWNEDKQAWYVNATVDRPVKAAKKGRWKAVLAVDVNPDHLAWALVNRHGNPTQYGRIELDLTGTANQNTDRIGVAIRQLVKLALQFEVELDGPVCIAHELLDFQRARAGLRYCKPSLSRLLSSFAYNKILTTLTHRAVREGITTRAVNPAWTSVLGQANYAALLGISVDQAAAVVIGRRALGLRTRIRPGVLQRLLRELQEPSGTDTGAAPIPARDGMGKEDAHAPPVHNDSSGTEPGEGVNDVMNTASPELLRKLARRLGYRVTTWDHDGLAARALVLAASADGIASISSSSKAGLNETDQTSPVGPSSLTVVSTLESLTTSKSHQALLPTTANT